MDLVHVWVLCVWHGASKPWGSNHESKLLAQKGSSIGIVPSQHVQSPEFKPPAPHKLKLPGGQAWKPRTQKVKAG